MDGRFNKHGGWDAPPDSPHRSLTAEEVADLRAYAESHTPEFGGDNNADFNSHHPVAREIWSRRGVGPKEE